MFRGFLTCSCSRTCLDDNDCFLHNVVDASINQIQQNIDTTFRRFLDLDGTSSNSSDGFSNKVDINFTGIPMKEIMAIQLDIDAK
jgi:hypothetical protein